MDLAAKVKKMVDLSRWSNKNILVTGGLSLNRPFLDDLRRELPGSEISVIPESEYFEVFGASIISEDEAHSEDFSKEAVQLNDSTSHFDRLRAISEFQHLLDYRVNNKAAEKIDPDDQYILGVDAGSTTTKAVLYNYNTGKIDASCYLRTNGNPVEATRQCLIEIRHKTGEAHLNIIQAAVTGSGRELVSVFFDNALVFNEILAHARAAVEEVPEVDTIFEIGGQDSKFISLLEGVPFDYTMNEGCSAGTGSFLEESALVDMNIPFEEISTYALSGGNPIAFGERCAAFINTDVRNALQQGAHQNDVLAGLVYSIADNYISRVV
jgi:predicted CoA-substrate-specific enzyme activase